MGLPEALAAVLLESMTAPQFRHRPRLKLSERLLVQAQKVAHNAQDARRVSLVKRLAKVRRDVAQARIRALLMLLPVGTWGALLGSLSTSSLLVYRCWQHPRISPKEKMVASDPSTLLQKD